MTASLRGFAVNVRPAAAPDKLSTFAASVL
jgi:hypothetical protein